MAIRTNTVEYAFPLATASVASATARDFTQIAALAIPEQTSRTFRSVTLECSYVDNGAAAASQTAVLMGIALGAVARNDATVTVTINNSGENQAMLFTRDVTSYFQTNYTGTTMTADCRLTVTGLATQNATAKLIITYEYDDSGQTTRIKTVKIPVDGNTGNLTTSFVNVGGVASQIPALDTFLPESSKTYRDIFFQIDSHTGTTAAASGQLDMSYDGGTSTVSDLAWGHTLNSDTALRRIDKLLATLATNATGSLQAKTTSATGEPVPCLCGVLVVTYEYDHSASSTILNSIQIPCVEEWGNLGGTATGDKSRYVTNFWVEEPDTITLVQSAVLVVHSASGANTMDLRCGSQGSRTFAHAASARCGGVLANMLRIDSGGASGAGMTLARGYNTLTLDAFDTTNTAGSVATNVSGLLYLNYTSGKHANGAGVHNHTTHWMVRPHSTTAPAPRIQSAVAITPVIPETSYMLVGVTQQTIMQTGGTAIPGAVAVLAECQSGEAEGAGWHVLCGGNYVSDTEMGYSFIYSAARSEYLRWPGDPDSSKRLDIETARDYRFDSTIGGAGDGCFWQAAMLLTYHAITWTIAGTVSGSGGGTVTLMAHRTDTGEQVGSTTRAGEGSYSLTWYDNTINVVVTGTEDATHSGASAAGLAA